MQMAEVEVGVARFSDLTSQANKKVNSFTGERTGSAWCISAGFLRLAVFLFLLRFMGALIFLIGAVRFFNLASPAALLTLVGRNKTPDKPLGALP